MAMRPRPEGRPAARGKGPKRKQRVYLSKSGTRDIAGEGKNLSVSIVARKKGKRCFALPSKKKKKWEGETTA